MKRTTRPHSLESPEYRANVHTIQPYIFYVGTSDKQYVIFAVCNAVSYVHPYLCWSLVPMCGWAMGGNTSKTQNIRQT